MSEKRKSVEIYHFFASCLPLGVAPKSKESIYDDEGDTIDGQSSDFIRT